MGSFNQSLTCQVCLELMHKPYALAPCGHTACHGCLLNWFNAPPADVPANEWARQAWLRKKTCPHCRAVVRERPVEVWVIKDMVAALVKSGLAPAPLYPPLPAPAELAPDADPWAGVFRPKAGAPENDPELMGAYDDEDGGVFRCLDCHHEIWGGACTNCHREYPGHGGDDDLHGMDFHDDGSDFSDLHPMDHGVVALLRQQLLGNGGEWVLEADFDGSGGDTAPASDDEDGSAVEFEDAHSALGEDGSDSYEGSFIDDGDGSQDGTADSAGENYAVGYIGRRPARLVGGRAGPIRPSRMAPIVISDDESDGDYYRGESPAAFDERCVQSLPYLRTLAEFNSCDVLGNSPKIWGIATDSAFLSL